MKPKKGERFFIFFLIFGVSFSTKNKRETLLLFSSQSPNNKKNNNKKGLFGLFSFARRSETRAAAEEKIETTMTRCVVYSCFDEISFVSFCTMLFRYFNAFPSKFLKIKLTINLNLLFSRTVAHWRRITRRSVYDHRSFLPPLKGITTERVLRQQNFGVVVKKGRR